MDGLASYLNGTVSDNSVDDTSGDSDSWSTVYLFMGNNWSWDNLGSYDSTCWGKSTSISSSYETASISSSYDTSCYEAFVPGWSSSAQCQTGRQNQKLSHCISVL